VTIPKENISVYVSYGGKDITLNTNPVITFDTEISGKTVNGSFNGQIYIGQFVVSNLGLYLSPGFVYEISIRYIMINSYRNIDTFTSTMITGIKNSFTNSNKKTESRMTFTTAPASSSIDSFLLSRQ